MLGKLDFLLKGFITSTAELNPNWFSAKFWGKKIFGDDDDGLTVLPT